MFIAVQICWDMKGFKLLYSFVSTRQTSILMLVWRGNMKIRNRSFVVKNKADMIRQAIILKCYIGGSAYLELDVDVAIC